MAEVRGVQQSQRCKPEADSPVDTYLKECLTLIRTHLCMDVAFIGEFVRGQRIFRHVSSSDSSCRIQAGQADPLDETYCQRIVEGRLPALIQDALMHPDALSLRATKAFSIRSHLSTPIVLQNARVYGTLCCFSSTRNATLGEKDTHLLRLFADLIAKYIERHKVACVTYEEKVDRISRVLDGHALTIVYQPIYNVVSGSIVGFEGLSRFSAKPIRSPDVWFAEAASVGLGVALEVRAIELLLLALPALPGRQYLSFNVSPETVMSGALEDTLQGKACERLMLEITEHKLISEYQSIGQALEPLRAAGIRIAVDDAGAGYASFRHILKLAPDVIKLDMSLTRGIEQNTAQRALAAALIRFAQDTGCVIVSEGVETEQERMTLKSLGVETMQGYLLGRPMAIEQAVSICGRQRHSG